MLEWAQKKNKDRKTSPMMRVLYFPGGHEVKSLMKGDENDRISFSGEAQLVCR